MLTQIGGGGVDSKLEGEGRLIVAFVFVLMGEYSVTMPVRSLPKAARYLSD